MCGSDDMRLTPLMLQMTWANRESRHYMLQASNCKILYANIINLHI